MRTFIIFFYFFIFLFSINNLLHAQSSISLGFGVPEYINIGYKWHKNQSGYSFSVGAVPANNDFLISARAGYLYHFYGSRKQSTIKPWYLNLGFAYNGNKSNSNLDQYLMADFRVGREYSISSKFGAYTEIGVFYIFWDKVSDNSFEFAFNYKNSIVPSINLGFYYRFQEDCHCPKIKKKP